MKQNNQLNEDLIDFKAIFSMFADRWYLFVISLMIALGVGYFVVKTSPRLYTISAVMKMNAGSTEAQELLGDLDNTRIKPKKDVNIEDEISVIKSTRYIGETIDQLDMNVSYFIKGQIESVEIYKDDFPVNIQLLDTSCFQIIGVPIYINILSDDEFELRVKGKDVRLYNFIEKQFTDESIPVIDFRKKYRFDQPVQENFLKISVSLTGNPYNFANDKMYFILNSPKALVNQYYSLLSVESQGRDSHLLKISMIGSNIQKEREFINTLMEVVIQNDLEKKNNESLRTIEFVDSQLFNISDSLNKARRDMESVQHSTTDIGATSALFANRDKYESEISALKVKLSYYRNIRENLGSLNGASNISAPSSVGINDPMLSDLLIKYSDLIQQRAQLSRTATEANPLMKELDFKIQTTKNALRDNLEEAARSTNIAIKDLQSRLNKVNASIRRLPRTEIRKLGIERKYQFSGNTYDLLLQKKISAGIALATNVSNWEIIEPARREGSRPISPNTLFIYLLATVLGIGLPMFVLLVMNYFSTEIKDKTQIEKITDIPILGVIMKGRKEKPLITQYNPKSPMTESFRELQLNLQYIFTDEGEKKVIGITSSTSGEGKTFCAVNLAITLAKSRKKVLLLDGDMRNSNLHAFFKTPGSGPGLSTLLIKKSTLAESIIQTEVQNLDIIASGPFPPNPVDLLHLDRFGLLITELKKKYDFIIIDSPPLGIVADYIIYSKLVDATIYVTRYNFTKTDWLDKISNLHQEGKIKNISIIFNGVKSSSVYGYTEYLSRSSKRSRFSLFSRKMTDKVKVSDKGV